MWTSRHAQLPGDRAIRVTIGRESSGLSTAEVLQLWRSNPGFRDFFNSLLAKAPFAGFRWETPPITAVTAKCAFEFVLLDSPGLERQPDPQAFASHFAGQRPAGVVEFANLGGDARLVVPCPGGGLAAYGHIGTFVRVAPEAQRHALWQAVGAAMERRLSVRPVWLSTAGAGVAWLHVRLDDRPKYYGYAPYRSGA
ncbi:MAG: hypothetical protein ABI661_01385 [Gammaproteobacteria bacterium]